MIPAYAQQVSVGPAPADPNPTAGESALKIFASYLGGVAKKKETERTEMVDYLKTALASGQAYMDASGKVNALPWERTKNYMDMAHTAMKMQQIPYDIKYKEGAAANQFAQANMTNLITEQSRGGTAGAKLGLNEQIASMVAQLKQGGFKADPMLKSRIRQWVETKSGMRGNAAEQLYNQIISQIDADE